MVRTFTLIAAAALAFPLSASEVGDDGLHKAEWMRETLKDLTEDLAEADEEGLRLALIVEQRGCIYCTKMHAEVFSRNEVAQYIRENFFMIQVDARGEANVTDFDGETLSERESTRKWGLAFTPTILFLPKEVPKGLTAAQAAVAVMPGAMKASTTLDLFTWVHEEGYASDPDGYFQRYDAR